MKYCVVLDGKMTTEYTRGRINGIIYVLSGMPQISYGYTREATEYFDHYITAFEGDEDMCQTIGKTINELYPGVIIQIRTN